MEDGNLDHIRKTVDAGADAACITAAHIPPPEETDTYIEIMRYLFSMGTDVNYTGFDEGIMITFPAYRRQLKYLELLVESGADVNLAQPSNGVTALHIAVQHNLLDVVQFLLESGADVNQTCHDDAPTSDPGHVYGETALHFAAAGADKEIIEALLEAGADKSIKSSKGETPLDYAQSPARPSPIRSKTSEGGSRSEEILQLLR